MRFLCSMNVIKLLNLYLRSRVLGFFLWVTYVGIGKKSSAPRIFVVETAGRLKISHIPGKGFFLQSTTRNNKKIHRLIDVAIVMVCGTIKTGVLTRLSFGTRLP